MEFELDRFVSAARTAAAAPAPARAMRALMRATVADPRAVAAGMPALEGEDEIFHEDETVCVSWARFNVGELVPPHNHKILAFVGVYRGVEVNRLYRCTAGGIELAAEKRLEPGDVLVIPRQAIHGVYAGGGRTCEALHVYLGPLSAIDRELFDPDSGAPMPFTDANYRTLLRPWPVSGA